MDDSILVTIFINRSTCVCHARVKLSLLSIISSLMQSNECVYVTLCFNVMVYDYTALIYFP